MRLAFIASSASKRISKLRFRKPVCRFPKLIILERCSIFTARSVPEWEKWRPRLNLLNRFGVNARYPGESAEEAESTQAFEICTEIRAALRSHLAPGEELG